MEGLLRCPCTCPDLDSHFAGAGVGREGISLQGHTTYEGFPLGGSCHRRGRMRGRFCTQPFLVEGGACRPDAFLLPPRWVSRSPPHPTRLRRPTYGLWWLRLDLTEQSPGLFDPRGEGFGRGSFPAEHPILPPNRLTRQGTPRRVSPPAGGERKSNHVLTGSAGQNILLAPRVPALLARVGVHPPILGAQRSGSQNSRPPWCSFLRLSSKESRAPRRSRRGPRGAAPQRCFGATHL